MKFTKMLNAMIFANALMAGQASAINFNINTTQDTHDTNLGDGLCQDNNGRCSLRAAIEEANEIGTNTRHNIYLQANVTYNLIHGSLVNDVSLGLRGTLDKPSTIRPADNADRSKKFQLLVNKSDGDIVFNDLIIRDGVGTDAFRRGVGFFNSGFAWIQGNVAITNNRGERTPGAGIYNSGALRISDSAITNNFNKSGSSTNSRGGGIYNSGVLLIERSSITGNSAGFGGGIFTSGRTVISTSSVSAPDSDERRYLSTTSARTILINSTIADNDAHTGGGIFSEFSRLAIYKSAIVSNQGNASGISGSNTHLSGGGGIVYTGGEFDFSGKGSIGAGASIMSSFQCSVCHFPVEGGSKYSSIDAERFTLPVLAAKIQSTMQNCTGDCAESAAMFLKLQYSGSPSNADFQAETPSFFISQSIVLDNRDSRATSDCSSDGRTFAFGKNNRWGRSTHLENGCGMLGFHERDTTTTFEEMLDTNIKMQPVGIDTVGRVVAQLSNGPWSQCNGANSPAFCSAGPETARVSSSDMYTQLRENNRPLEFFLYPIYPGVSP